MRISLARHTHHIPATIAQEKVTTTIHDKESESMFREVMAGIVKNSQQKASVGIHLNRYRRCSSGVSVGHSLNPVGTH
jgi:hypothetical protein